MAYLREMENMIDPILHAFVKHSLQHGFNVSYEWSFVGRGQWSLNEPIHPGGGSYTIETGPIEADYLLVDGKWRINCIK